jgi:hypothetical protein
MILDGDHHTGTQNNRNNLWILTILLTKTSTSCINRSTTRDYKEQTSKMLSQNAHSEKHSRWGICPNQPVYFSVLDSTGGEGFIH